MIQKHKPSKLWSAILLLLTAVLLFTVAACSSGEQLLLAEFNRDFEAEIFLAELGSESGEWQSLAEDAVSTILFDGRYATFVPDTNHILLWYEDGNDLRVEQMEIGDDAPTELFEGDVADRVFGSVSSDPFLIFLTETEDFSEFSCYVSVDGAEAERLAKGSICWVSEHGVVSEERDEDELTLTLYSLDGEEETVILDGVEDVLDTAWNQDLSTFAYVELDRRDAQAYMIEPGDDEATPIGDEFEVIVSVGFMADGETIYIVGKPDEDDDEAGLFINGTGDPILEEESIRYAGRDEEGDYVLFRTLNSRGETLFVYDVNDETAVEVADGDAVSTIGYLSDRLLFSVAEDDDFAVFSAEANGAEPVELFADNDFEVIAIQVDEANGRIYLTLRDEDGLSSLFVSSLDAEDGYILVEEWATISLLNSSDDTAVFAAREDFGDDWILYAIPVEDGADEIELDDDAENGFENAFLTGNGRSLIYTAVGDDISEAEVRQAPLDGEENPETLYKDILLLDVNWEGASNLERLR
ncbi:hypothetical protein [Candidatus Leptofilum sp.]|uniref:hypothetical protein n=1 Tax=Candidatus Leptofilum sp. TaxID=3241576 RepID=UPI003B59474F